MSGTRTYEPPEMDTYWKGVRSRKYDIWLMGCLFLEFAIWLLSGTKEMERFKKARECSTYQDKDYQFYRIIRGTQNGNPLKAEIYPEVCSWMDEIYKHSQCKGDTALKDLLTLIDKRLLRIEIEGRADAIELYDRLNKIVENAESHHSYLLNGADALQRTALLGPRGFLVAPSQPYLNVRVFPSSSNLAQTLTSR